MALQLPVFPAQGIAQHAGCPALRRCLTLSRSLQPLMGVPSVLNFSIDARTVKHSLRTFCHPFWISQFGSTDVAALSFHLFVDLPTWTYLAIYLSIYVSHSLPASVSQSFTSVSQLRSPHSTSPVSLEPPVFKFSPKPKWEFPNMRDSSQPGPAKTDLDLCRPVKPIITLVAPRSRSRSLLGSLYEALGPKN